MSKTRVWEVKFREGELRDKNYTITAGNIGQAMGKAWKLLERDHVAFAKEYGVSTATDRCWIESAELVAEAEA